MKQEETVKKRSEKAQKAETRVSSPARDFLLASLNMSWQLAIVVLVPILGGFQLDKALNTLPALTMIGFFIAMAGMAVVVWHQMQLYNGSGGAK